MTEKRANGLATGAFLLAAASATNPALAADEAPAVAPFGAIQTALQQGLTAYQKANNFKPAPEDKAMFGALEKRHQAAAQLLSSSQKPVVYGVGISANDGITTLEQWGVELRPDGSAYAVLRLQQMNAEKAQQDPRCVASYLTGGPCFDVVSVSHVMPDGKIAKVDPASYSLAPFGLKNEQTGTPFKHEPRLAASSPASAKPTPTPNP